MISTDRCQAMVGAFALGLTLLLGCSSPAPPAQGHALPPSAAPVPAPRRLPPANARFDYQIGGAYAPAASVGVVDRDRAEAPVPGRYNICYVNAFQTQPEERAFWTGLRADLLVRRKGRGVTDPNWPGEYLLDTSTPAKRAALGSIVGRWVEDCATAGYQAVELDNLDSWTRAKTHLRRTDNVAFAMDLVRRGHAAGLAMAQKNTSELGVQGRDRVGFDFAIAEECEVYRECGDYTRVYGNRVIEIEYSDNPQQAYTRACRARGRRISVILRDRNVVPQGTKGYHYRSC